MSINNATLTELQLTKMQLFALRHQTMQQAIQTNLQERAALIAEIVAEHPGHRWDDATGQLVAESKTPQIVRGKKAEG